jgi:hypothetical protein
LLLRCREREWKVRMGLRSTDARSMRRLARRAADMLADCELKMAVAERLCRELFTSFGGLEFS